MPAAAGLQSRAHRCLPRMSRVLSCSQHVHSEPHSAAAPSLDALSLRQVLTSVARDGSIATDIGEVASASCRATDVFQRSR